MPALLLGDKLEEKLLNHQSCRHRGEQINESGIVHMLGSKAGERPRSNATRLTLQNGTKANPTPIQCGLCDFAADLPRAFYRHSEAEHPLRGGGVQCPDCDSAPSTTRKAFAVHRGNFHWRNECAYGGCGFATELRQEHFWHR